MALFKISKGLSKNLMTNVPYAKEGFAYFTSDDGKFYIDIDGDGTNTSPAIIGDNRIPLSALSTDWIKATKIEDTETYPILAFKVADNTKNLIELKYGRIGYKDGTLVIPNVETGSKDEVLIENNDEGSALIIDNKGAGTGIKIINTGEDSLVNNWGININNNILLNMNGSASFEGNVVIGGTHIFKGDAVDILGVNKTNTIVSNQLTLQQGAVFGGAGLITRDICGISDPTDDGACEKDSLYINYDGDNSYKASRHVILQAGEAGEDYGQNLYQYAAARGDAVHDWALNNFYIKSDINKKLDNLLATNDAMVFKGTIGGDAAATIHELPAKHSAGETYRVYDIKGGNDGKYLGNGEVCEIGDLIICIKDGTTHSAGDWTIVQTNIDGAVINTDGSSTDGHIAIFSGEKGRIIKDSGKSFDDLATANHTHTKLVNDKYAVDFNGASLSPVNDPQNTIDLGNTSNPWQNLYLTSDIKFKDISGNWKTLTEKLADKSNVGHKHTIADTDGLQTALDNKSNTGHTHAISNIIDLQDTLDNKAPKSHNHDSNYLKLSGGTMTGQIQKDTASSWVNGRNTAIIRSIDSDSERFHVLASSKTPSGSWEIGSLRENFRFSYVTDTNYNAGNNTSVASVQVTSGGVLYGAAWNDYAEFRICNEEFKPGQVVLENGDDTLSIASKRLQRGCSIVSDTFGFAIGETDQAKTPIAVSGRVLAYPYESREEFKKNIGRPVCSGPNGTVSIMTDEEYREKGYCAIGTISAVPDYEEWGTGKVKVNGRVWIKVF